MAKISQYTDGGTIQDSDLFVSARSGQNYKNLWSTFKSTMKTYFDTLYTHSSTPHAPGGRLTLVTATPVMSTEQASKTTIYYTPYKGDLVPIYDGTNWDEETFAEISLALDSNALHTGYHQSGKNFDLFVYSDSGTLRLVSGPAWTNDTTRAIALEYVNGILMNAASMTARYGSVDTDTVTVARDRGTYVGTFRASADGTTTWEIGGTAANGDPILLYLWNAYNRISVATQCRDNTNSWTYAGSGVWAPLNNSATNRASVVLGLNEDAVKVDLHIQGIGSATGYVANSVGLDSTSSPTGIVFRNGSATVAPMSVARYAGNPGIGFHYFQALEYTDNGGTPVTLYGDAGSAFYQEGLQIEAMM